MLDWLDAGKYLMIQGGTVYVVGLKIRAGTPNTLESLERLGLAERKLYESGSVRFYYCQKPSSEEQDL